jgi:hypothetical protein
VVPHIVIFKYLRYLQPSLKLIVCMFVDVLALCAAYCQAVGGNRLEINWKWFGNQLEMVWKSVGNELEMVWK